MTHADIKRFIKEANVNRGIRWVCTENKPNMIVLTNSYDKCVRFDIYINRDCVVVRDAHLDTGVAFFSKGDTRYDDYTNDDYGVSLAIKAAVNYFNRTY